MVNLLSLSERVNRLSSSCFSCAGLFFPKIYLKSRWRIYWVALVKANWLKHNLETMSLEKAAPATPGSFITVEVPLVCTHCFNINATEEFGKISPEPNIVVLIHYLESVWHIDKGVTTWLKYPHHFGDNAMLLLKSYVLKDVITNYKIKMIVRPWLLNRVTVVNLYVRESFHCPFYALGNTLDPTHLIKILLESPAHAAEPASNV